MTQQEIDSIINDYVNGLTLVKTCKKYHHRESTIKDILFKNNIHIRNKSEAGKKAEKIHVSKDIEDKIVENYLNGKGLISSGKDFGIGPQKVRNILVSRNIKIRSYSESASISNSLRKKYFCNLDYFKNENQKMAYILGFISADGSISLEGNVLKISLARKDRELLEKIKNELEYTGDIKDYTNSKGFDISSLSITCKEYKEDLAKYNIVPQKTYTFSFPKNLNKKYWIDFIRGYFDGDGSVSTAGPHAIRFQICAHRREVLETIVNFFYEEYNIPKVNIQIAQREKNNLYFFQYSTSSTKEIYNKLYYPNCICLPRKYEKYTALI